MNIIFKSEGSASYVTMDRVLKNIECWEPEVVFSLKKELVLGAPSSTEAFKNAAEWLKGLL